MNASAGSPESPQPCGHRGTAWAEEIQSCLDCLDDFALAMREVVRGLGGARQ